MLPLDILDNKKAVSTQASLLLINVYTEAHICHHSSSYTVTQLDAAPANVTGKNVSRCDATGCDKTRHDATRCDVTRRNTPFRAERLLYALFLYSFCRSHWKRFRLKILTWQKGIFNGFSVDREGLRPCDIGCSYQGLAVTLSGCESTFLSDTMSSLFDNWGMPGTHWCIFTNKNGLLSIKRIVCS